MSSHLTASKPKVGLFVTCLIDAMRPSIGFSVIELLESAGCEVVVPANQTCCGQPGFNSGDHAAGVTLARKFLDEFESFDYVVVPSGSCGGMLKTHSPELFPTEPAIAERLRALAARTYELTDFLATVMQVKTVPACANPQPKTTVTYHDSCSGLRELGVQAQPRGLLALVPELKLIEMKDCRACCGFGGTFSVKYGNISSAIVDEKIANIQATGAQAVVLGDVGCMLNIEGRLRRIGDDKTQVLHVAEVLAGQAQPSSIKA
jgi:L-lactate dehydrogenase complex protein LldE